MIVDASAVLAILFNEADAELFARALHEVDDCRMSAVNYLEGPSGSREWATLRLARPSTIS